MPKRHYEEIVGSKIQQWNKLYDGKKNFIAIQLSFVKECQLRCQKTLLHLEFQNWIVLKGYNNLRYIHYKELGFLPCRKAQNLL